MEGENYSDTLKTSSSKYKIKLFIEMLGSFNKMSYICHGYKK